MSITDAPELLTLNEVAERLRLSRRTVERLVDAEILPALRVGKRAIRVDNDELQQWLYGAASEETAGIATSAAALPAEPRKERGAPGDPAVEAPPPAGS